MFADEYESKSVHRGALVILIDYSQVVIGNLHQQLKMSGSGTDVNPDLLRHMVLNSIRKITKTFGGEYGQIVICSDGFKYWRKNIFSHYKANRKKSRDDSGIDWNLVFETLKDIRQEVEENFPYKVMHVPHAEADDIIATLVKNYREQERILVVSSDHDFVQLLHPNVDIYRPIQNVMIQFTEEVA